MSEQSTVEPVPAPTPERWAGSRRAAAIAWVVAVLGFVAIVVSQHIVLPGERESKAHEAPSALVPPSNDDPELQSAKLSVKVHALFKDQGQDAGAMFMGLGVEPHADPVSAFRQAILAAELVGAKDAGARLDKLDLAAKTDLGRPLSESERDRLQREIESVRKVLDGRGDGLAEAEKTALIDDHGWYARLAFSLGKPEKDPGRASITAGGAGVIALVFLVLEILGVALVGGLSACIVAIVLAARGRLRFTYRAALPVGSVGIETVAVFFVAFLVLQVVGEWLLPNIGLGIGARLSLQWLLALVPLWPLMRGMPGPAWRERIGWTAPRGVMREIGAGIFAYFATLPLIAVAVALAMLILVVQSAVAGGQFERPRNPVQEILGEASPGVLVLLFLLATLWAPFVEESIFRGALFAQLRSRIGVLLTATITGVVFGMMHGYPLPLLLPVITLGFCFALMREWRTSLLASMTGHFLHNATLLTLGIMIAHVTR